MAVTQVTIKPGDNENVLTNICEAKAVKTASQIVSQMQLLKQGVLSETWELYGNVNG